MRHARGGPWDRRFDFRDQDPAISALIRGRVLRDYSRMLYFDCNATAPLSAEACEAWVRAAESYPGNPSSLHRLGGRAELALQGAREELAALLACDPGEIVWTSGATEANNLAVADLKWRSKGAALVSTLEHPSVLEPARHHFAKDLEIVPVLASGLVDLAELESRMQGRRHSFVGLMAANNETGILQPWQEVQRICAAVAVPLLCDATQWIGKLPAKGLGRCDYVSGSAHKFGGPKGVGFLKGPAAVRPLFRGGKQEEGRRAGTENLPGIISMMAALKQREKELGDDGHRLREIWRKEFERAVQREIPGARIAGADAPRLWNTVAITLPEVDCRQRWVVKLDKQGVAASTGSACASGEEKPSPLLCAMGLSPNEAGRTVRFSAGWETPEDDWKQLVKAVKTVYDQMHEAAPR